MRAEHYAVLVCIHTARLMGDRHGLRPEQIRARLYPEVFTSAAALGHVLSQLTDPNYHTDGPLLRFERQRYVICGTDDTEGDEQTGAFKALAEARANPRLPANVRVWLDEARTGMTPGGARSDLSRAAAPTGNTVRGDGRDPERVARVVDMGFCSRCHHVAGRRGWKALSEFRKVKGGARRYECKECERELKQRRKAERG